MAGGRVFRRTVKGVQQKTWTAQYDAPSDAAGKRKQKMKSGFKTKAEAQAFLAKVQTEINTGNFFEPTKMTLRDYTDYWLENYARHNVAENTLFNYKAKLFHVRNRPVGSIEIGKLKGHHIQQLYSDLLDSGLQNNTVREYHKVLVNCLNHAVHPWKFIKVSPMREVIPPKRKTKKVAAVTPENIQAILDAARGDRFFDLYFLAAMTGMRRGELLGLTWKSIDFENSTLTIYQSVIKAGPNIRIKEGGKTDDAVRTIAISESVLQVLKKRKITQAKHKLAMGSAYNDLDLVFAKEIGDPEDPPYVSECFKKFATKAGLPNLHLHDLRHGHASWLLALGESVKLVAERLGHSDPSITLQTYSHLLPNAQKHAAEKLEGIVIANDKPTG